MIAPDSLLKLQAANLGCGSAAIQSVKPAIGSPGQMVRHRLGVLHAEAAQQHLRVAIGNIVAVLVGIKEQIGRLHHEHAAVAERDAGDKIQVADEILELVGVAVAVGIFHDRDAVGSLGAAGRRLRHAIVNSARVAVDADPLQSRRIRVLQILNGPEPPAIVELHQDRLADVRLAGENVASRPSATWKVLRRLGYRIPLSIDVRRAGGSQNDPYDEFHFPSCVALKACATVSRLTSRAFGPARFTVSMIRSMISNSDRRRRGGGMRQKIPYLSPLDAPFQRRFDALAEIG